MRVFVAVDISDAQTLSSLKNLQSSLKIAAKPIDIEKVHFTLMFLGEVTDEVLQKVQSNLKTINFEPFNISFEGVGVFPNPKFPRVVWVGLDDFGGSKLVSLAKQVEESLSPLGFSNDKPFKPHATLFRIKNKVENIKEELEKFSSKRFGTQRVNEIKLKKSILTPSGPLYSDLEVILAR